MTNFKYRTVTSISINSLDDQVSLLISDALADPAVAHDAEQAVYCFECLCDLGRNCFDLRRCFDKFIAAVDIAISSGTYAASHPAGGDILVKMLRRLEKFQGKCDHYREGQALWPPSCSHGSEFITGVRKTTGLFWAICFDN